MATASTTPMANTATRPTRKAGDFCWINILTEKPAGARAFFSELLGWTFTDMPGVGYGIKVGDSNIGGFFDVVNPNTGEKHKPVVGVMVKVENADKIVARVREFGGTAQDAFDIGPAGRMAVCHDPLGANFDVWEPRSMPGTDVLASVHGAPSWSECATTDAARATEFYTKLFDWKAETMDMGNLVYTTFTNGAAPKGHAGLLAITPDMGAGMKPSWWTYITVTDPDATAKKATSLGGTVILEPRAIPTVGRFAGIMSPAGVMFYVIRYEPRAA